MSGVAARCRAAGVGCVAIVGGMDRGAVELLDAGVDAIVPAVIDVCSHDEALSRAWENYLLAARRTFSLLKLGMGVEARD